MAFLISLWLTMRDVTILLYLLFTYLHPLHTEIYDVPRTAVAVERIADVDDVSETPACEVRNDVINAEPREHTL